MPSNTPVAASAPSARTPPSVRADCPGASWTDADPAELGFDRATLVRAVERFGGICGEDGHAQVLIVRGGRVAWRGPDVELVHPVWSCTKSYLSACFGLMWDDGRCGPDTRVAEILPAYAEAYGTVTLGQLATFAGGFRSVEGPGLAPAEPLHAPGAAMHYGEQSNLLALAVTTLAGEPLRELFMRRIGRPIGIAEEHLEWGVQDVPDQALVLHGGTGAPPAGVSTNAIAMARFGLLCARGGVWRGERLLGERYLSAALRPQVPAELPPHLSDGWYRVLPGRYGLHFWVNGCGPDGEPMWPSLTARTAAIQGNRNNICVMVPEWDLLILRLGDDPAVNARGYDEAFALIRKALQRGGGLPPA